MYYETTMHTRRHVTNAAEAAKLIHDREARDYDAIVWNAPDGRELCAVADNHCNNPWLEVAVIDLGNEQQIESITFGWIDTLEEKTRYLTECEIGDFRMGKPGGAKLPLDGKRGDIQASFECGCCGTFFNSTYEKQRKYDQDNGFGICPSCAKN